MLNTLSNFRHDFSISALVTALVAVMVSFSGPAVVIFQAAAAGGLNSAQLASWIWAIALGSGFSGLYLSLKYKAPVITAWSTPGAAILVSALPLYSYPEAIGAFILSAVLITLSGMTGLFSWLVNKLPENIIAAMLAGILFNFGIQIFTPLNTAVTSVLPIIASTVASYLFAKKYRPQYAVVIALAVGLVVASTFGTIAFDTISFNVVTPIVTPPQWSFGAVFGITIPLFLVTMSSQNAPGYAVLKESGYTLPLSPLVTVTGLASLVFAPFGAHGVNLAAITAAICTGSDSHADPQKRYVAGIFCGLFYIIVGIFGVVVASLFQSLPKALIYAIGGLALLGALSSSISKTLADETHREVALLTFLLTASNVTILHIGSAFWGLMFGIIASAILNRKKTSAN